MNITNIISKLPRKGVQDTAHTLKQITHLIVHHDAATRTQAYDSVVRYRNQASYHIGRGEDGLQYHYRIDNVGEVFQTRNLTDTLWHCSNYEVNRASIAICVDGNFVNQKPTKEQYQSLKLLLDWLSTQHPEFPADHNDVYYHNEVAKAGMKTQCCGDNLFSFVKNYRTKKGKVEIPNVAYNNGKMDNNIVVVQPAEIIIPPVAQPTIYRVYDYAGTQVGAYTDIENAKKKLDTLEAGVVKDNDYKAIITKDKPISVTIPFVGLPESPVVEVITLNDAIAPVEEKPVTAQPRAIQTEVPKVTEDVKLDIWGVIKLIIKIWVEYRQNKKKRSK
jgi:hypothetical protein